MKPEIVRQALEEYNEHEKFYKAYYASNVSKEERQQFLECYPVSLTRKKQWIVEEYKEQGGWYPENMDDAFSFSGTKEIVLSKHNRFTPPFKHRHTFFEFVYVVSGQCKQTFQNETVYLKQGQLSLISPFTVHEIGVFDDSIVLNILIKRKTFETLFHRLLPSNNPIQTFFDQALYLYSQNGYLLIDTHENEDLKNVVLNMYDQSTSYKMYANTILTSLLLYLFGSILQLDECKIQTPTLATKGSKTVIQLLETIKNDFDTITLSTLADRYHFSQAYVSRLIKKQTGKSFTDLVLDIRFEKATYLLETSKEPIHEIAYVSGFENIEHFNRMFKKRFSITPGQYRKLNSNAKEMNDQGLE